MDVIEPPRIVPRTQRESLGIRVVTPFRGMLRTRDELLGELPEWLKARGVDGSGPFFLRLHVIDMSGPMDIEVGVITPERLTGDDRVRALPCSRRAATRR